MEQAAFALIPQIPLGAMRSDRGMHTLQPRIADRLDGDAHAVFGEGSSMVQSILDHVHFGVTVVGPQLQLLFANKAALRECARHPVLRIDRGQLVMLACANRGDFMRAIAAARGGRWSLVQLVQGDDRMMLAVLPLCPNEAPDQDAPALVVFGMRPQTQPLAIQFYAQSCGLSPAETAVLRALGAGLSPKEIAYRHEVSLSTVRTQLRSIRIKTSTRTIRDLVLALGSLPPVMPAALGTG